MFPRSAKPRAPPRKDPFHRTAARDRYRSFRDRGGPVRAVGSRCARGRGGGGGCEDMPARPAHRRRRRESTTTLKVNAHKPQPNSAARKRCWPTSAAPPKPRPNGQQKPARRWTRDRERVRTSRKRKRLRRRGRGGPLGAARRGAEVKSSAGSARRRRCVHGRPGLKPHPRLQTGCVSAAERGELAGVGQNCWRRPCKYSG